MSEVVIKAEGLGKKFSISHQRHGDLRQTFGGAFRRLFNNGSESEEFWALKDISFEVKRGEVVGVIGRNGAGKSTLLKILSRITEPSFGRFEIDGRVSSLLEVGTGFHMELTGRENIYLNGTILGMRRAEIKRKFDEIVAFSGVENFIDTAVKHYSSGMKVRLAFSVAAHLEPEILIIDEVLAVGDAEFQKKCLGKMDEVSKQNGRTILFVSHNLGAVSQLCETGFLLDSGALERFVDINCAIDEYVRSTKSPRNVESFLNLDLRKGDGRFRVKKIRLLDDRFSEIAFGRTGAPLIFELDFDRTIDSDNGSFRIDLAIDSELDTRIGWFSSDVVAGHRSSRFKTVILSIPKFGFGAGTYYLTFYVTWNGVVADYIHQAFAFNIEEGDFFGTGKTIPRSQTFIYTEHQIAFS